MLGPLAALALLAWFINFEYMKYKCRMMARERGYLEATYYPPNRAGISEQCVCRKKLNADGTLDELARLVIDLD